MKENVWEKIDKRAKLERKKNNLLRQTKNKAYILGPTYIQKWSLHLRIEEEHATL